LIFTPFNQSFGGETWTGSGGTDLGRREGRCWTYRYCRSGKQRNSLSNLHRRCSISHGLAFELHGRTTTIVRPMAGSRRGRNRYLRECIRPLAMRLLLRSGRTEMVCWRGHGAPLCATEDNSSNIVFKGKPSRM